jgi:hypothetical protein
VSLILEALKKLERERDTPHRGFLVLGPVAWPEPGRARVWTAAAGAAVGVLVLAVVLLWAWRSREGSAHLTQSSPAAAIAPAPAPPATVALPPLASVPGGPRLTPPAPRDGVFPGVAPRRAPDTARRDGADAATTPGTSGREPAETVQPLVDEETKPEPTDEDRAADAQAQARSGGFHLTAISRRDGRPIAVLNDRFVHEGDVFDNVRVVRIGDDEVEIEVNGERQVVRF